MTPVQHHAAPAITLPDAREFMVRMMLVDANNPDAMDPDQVTRQEVRCRLAAIQRFHSARRPSGFGGINGFQRARLLNEGAEFEAVANDLARLVSIF